MTPEAAFEDLKRRILAYLNEVTRASRDVAEGLLSPEDMQVFIRCAAATGNLGKPCVIWCIRFKEHDGPTQLRATDGTVVP